jgi:hypothetical protein
MDERIPTGPHAYTKAGAHYHHAYVLPALLKALSGQDGKRIRAHQIVDRTKDAAAFAREWLRATKVRAPRPHSSFGENPICLRKITGGTLSACRREVHGRADCGDHPGSEEERSRFLFRCNGATGGRAISRYSSAVSKGRCHCWDGNTRSTCEKVSGQLIAWVRDNKNLFKRLTR